LWYWYKTEDNINSAIQKASSAICDLEKLDLLEVNGIECASVPSYEKLATLMECS
jgi:hypothetical protein